MARMQHRAGAVGRSEARQARIVALRVVGCVGSCLAVAVSISAFVFRAMSFRRRPVPSVSFLTFILLWLKTEGARIPSHLLPSRR